MIALEEVCERGAFSDIGIAGAAGEDGGTSREGTCEAESASGGIAGEASGAAEAGLGELGQVGVPSGDCSVMTPGYATRAARDETSAPTLRP